MDDDIRRTLMTHDAMVIISTELAARADGLLSLIAHRYTEPLPPDLIEDLLRTSYELRALYDPRA